MCIVADISGEDRKQSTMENEVLSRKNAFKMPTTPCKFVSSSTSPAGGSSVKKGRRRPNQQQPASFQQQTTGFAAPLRMSQEEIVDQMEKEQDAIVMRLLREIDTLREENSRLRRNMGHLLNGEPLSSTPPQSRRSSIASQRQQQLFCTSGSIASTPSSSRRSSFSQIDNLKSDLQKKRNSGCNYAITLSSSTSSPFMNAILPQMDSSAWPPISQEKSNSGAATLFSGHITRRPGGGNGGDPRMSKVRNRAGSTLF
ncbi:HFR020Wp [Eremothecium sinecaudum]|uniref:HFR020Wp n=1 Tax=Eremothecium sinecaudum TaxID=45286 RepID=A0A0X8HUY8_9SACH|nr:HFR020Wp [Eremothecium sinecaudum]AMD21875.1 HFR020Wp [Eremothecium sinecaudum]